MSLIVALERSEATPISAIGTTADETQPGGSWLELLVRLRVTIRAKILIAFLAMGCITAFLGWYGTGLIGEATKLVAETYDKPLIAINYARAVMADFAAAEAVFVRRHFEENPDRRAELASRMAELTDTLKEDLDIVAERSLSERAVRAVERVREALRDWDLARQALSLTSSEAADWNELDRSAAQVHEEVDLLVNFAAGDGFLARGRALQAVQSNGKVYAVGTCVALALSGIITLLLARRIIGPVRSASRAAARIARGDLDCPIPPAGRDELGALLGSMSVMRDHIKATIADEKAQRRSAQARMVDAVENSREGIVVVDDRGRIVIANSQMTTFLPAVSDLLRPDTSFVRTAAAAMRRGAFAPGSLATIRRWIEARGTVSAFEAELADGRWLQISFSPTREGGYVAIGSDITVLKEREGVLRLAKEQAEAANRSKTEFLTNMSHELRTPLNAVIGFSEIISMELYGPLGDPNYKDFAGDILTSGRHLLDVINDILDIAKSEAGKLQISLEPVDLTTLFESCRKIVHEQCARAELDLDIIAPDEPLAILADRVKAKQILLNLLSNAVKFTDGGGRVAMKIEPPREGKIAIAVSDTGIGMTSAETLIALTPFGQVNGGLARQYEGTGLGLPLTKALTELHGGTLSIESAPGRGTTVTVTFSLVEPSTALMDSGGHSDAASLSPGITEEAGRIRVVSSVIDYENAVGLDDDPGCASIQSAA